MNSRKMGGSGPAAHSLLILVVVAILATTANAAPATLPGLASALNVFALIPSKSVRDSGLDDLLAAELTRRGDIRLVERTQIQAIADEKLLTAVLTPEGAEGRSKIGHLLHADVLILLSQVKIENGIAIRVVLCDCNQGARLESQLLPQDPSHSEIVVARISEIVAKVRGRFATGVTWVLAVPPFLSRDFLHDHDELQLAYAHLLQNALEQIPGVAVVETEEAQAIRREQAFAGEAAVHRLVPLVIEGEYKTSQQRKDGPMAVSIHVRVADGVKPLKELHQEELSPAAAATFLSADLPAALVGPSAPERARWLSPDQQFEALTARAREFASLGSFENSVGLREAALLLKPDAGTQRIVLVKEYEQLMLARSFSAWEIATGKPLERLERLEHLVVEHLEYLVRNRQADIAVAHQLLLDGPNYAASAEFGKFLFEIFPGVMRLDLPPNPYPTSTPEDWRLALQYDLIDELFQTECSPSPIPERGVTFAGRLITELFPGDVSPPRGVAGWFAYWPFGGNPSPELCKAHKAFLDEVERHGKPVYVIAARAGKLAARVRDLLDGQVTSADVAEADALLADYKRLSLRWGESMHVYGDRPPLEQTISNLRGQILLRIHPPVFGPSPSTFPPARAAPDVTLQPIDMLVKSARSPPEPFEKHFGNLLLTVVPCGDGLDVFYWRNGIYLLRNRGVLEEMSESANQSTYYDVKWDGRYIWIAVENGLRALDHNGVTVATIGKQQGLPPGTYRLADLSPGHIFVAGIFGDPWRSWYGTIELDDSLHAQVRVMHEGTRIDDLGAPRQSDSRFVAWYIHVLRPSSGGAAAVREVLLGDGKVDLESGKFTLLDREHPRSNPLVEPGTFFSKDGVLLVIQEQKAVRYRYGGRPTKISDRSELCSISPPNPGENFAANFLQLGSNVYLPGKTWLRLDLRTLEQQILIPTEAVLRIPRAQFQVSSNYGIIAMGQQGQPGVYQVKFPTLTTPATRPSTAP